MFKYFKKIFSRQASDSLNDVEELLYDVVVDKSVLVQQTTSNLENKQDKHLVTASVISEIFLNEIRGWEVIDIPVEFYHGCKSGDQGINLENQKINGNKWFSTNLFYASSYAWHYSRQGSSSPNSRYCAKVGLSQNKYKAVVRPEHITDFPRFLARCFPAVLQSYELSRHFQNTLKAHLDAAYGVGSNVIGYYYHDGCYDEICIPDCDDYIKLTEFLSLPDDKDLLNEWCSQQQGNLGVGTPYA
ncbi:MAG: hypothetical protein ACK4ML_10820 [Alishewanella aestuarii]